MTRNSIHLLLVTTHQPSIKKIHSICKHVGSISYRVTISEIIPAKICADILLVAGRQLNEYMKEKDIRGLPTPIIGIYDGHSRDNQRNHSSQGYPCDCLDIKKITRDGFDKVISTAIERYHILSGLNEQKIILRNLITMLTEGSAQLEKDLSNELHSSSAKDLIEENKKLLEQVKNQNKKLRLLSRSDSLTGIANRLNFEESLLRTVARARRHGHILALLLIDLDKFKNINDTFGHQMGDLLLQEISRRIQKALRKGDFVARIGGDEFAVILHEIKNTHVAGIIASKLIQAINKPYDIEGERSYVGASIGIACLPMIAKEAHELIKQADIAMYRAKSSQMLKYSYATLSRYHDPAKKMVIERQLKEAIRLKKFSMVYQPVYRLPSFELNGFEALIRWSSPELDTIPSNQFIAIAEKSGLINMISEKVIESVCEQVSIWIKLGDFPYKISINLFPAQLAEEKFLLMISDIINRFKLSHKLFVFEITETAVTYDNQVDSNIIQELSKLGKTHVLGHCNVGHTVANQKPLLPITAIKINHSFIQDSNKEKTGIDKAASIITLAKKMGLKVVAEGVETQEQLQPLLNEQYDYAQGFYFSKPLTPECAMELALSKLTPPH